VGGRLGRQMANHLGCSESQGCSIVTFTSFQIMGRDAHNDQGMALRSMSSNWKWKNGCGRWVHTATRSYGFLPRIGNWQRNGGSEWAWADNFRAADEILGAFDLTMEDVIASDGPIEDGERRIYDLPSILIRLRPEICSDLHLTSASVGV